MSRLWNLWISNISRQWRMTMRKQYAFCFSLVRETIPKANLFGTVLSVLVEEQQSVCAFTSGDGQTCSAHVNVICCL
jgi:hypothetical protein